MRKNFETQNMLNFFFLKMKTILTKIKSLFFNVKFYMLFIIKISKNIFFSFFN